MVERLLFYWSIGHIANTVYIIMVDIRNNRALKSVFAASVHGDPKKLNNLIISDPLSDAVNRWTPSNFSKIGSDSFDTI